MSEFLNYSHPEFSERLRASSGDLDALKADYQDALHIFRADVALKFQKLGLASDTQWMMFSFGDECVYPKSGGGLADLLVMQIAGEIKTKSGHIIVRPLIRLLYSERYMRDVGAIFFTEDVTVDHEDDSQYLVGSFPYGTGENMSYCPVPMAIVEEDRLYMTPNYCAFTSIPDASGEAEESDKSPILPFGWYEDLADRQHALDRAALLFGLTSGREPVGKGDRFSFIGASEE